MNKINCNVIGDLLPLYVDGAVSEDTKKLVEEHLAECADCKKAAEDMEKEVDRYRSVTAEQLRAVAQSAFRKENGVILYYKKQQN